MALDPLLLDPQLHVALDNPPYRAQRILLSWIAWLLGLGKPFWILNAYAAINLIFWIWFAWLARRLFAPHGWPGFAGYAAVLRDVRRDRIDAGFADGPAELHVDSRAR